MTLVIGAGLSGLTAARTLADAGHSVVVLDKGRGVGGRLATRRVELEGETLRFDHGAQYFTARDPAFRAAVEAWQKAGVVQVWADDFASAPERAGGRQSPAPRYRGAEGMSGIARHLAEGLDVRTLTRVVRVAAEGARWLATTEAGEVQAADNLIVTSPVPQSLALLRESEIAIDATLHAGLAAVEYAPCLALLVTLAGPSAVPPPGGLFAGPEPVSWIADNTQKGVSPGNHGAVTVHAGPQYSRDYYDRPEAEIVAELMHASSRYFGSPVLTTSLQRWRYSLPTKVYPDRHAEWHGSLGGRLLFAGDAFGGPRVEGAYLSGRAAALALLHGNGTT